MTGDKKTVALMAPNIAFAGAVISATVFGVTWMGYLVVTFVWFMLVIYALASTSSKKSEKSQLAYVLMWIFDVCIFACFVYFHWYFTAIAYAVSCVLEGLATRVVGDI